MGRLIDADALLEEINGFGMTVTGLRAGKGVLQNYAKHYRDSINRIIDDAPTIDAVPVVHGRWEEYDRFICNSDGKPIEKIGIIWRCSECGREEDYREPYCHCGAKMDLEDDND